MGRTLPSASHMCLFHACLPPQLSPTLTLTTSTGHAHTGGLPHTPLQQREHFSTPHLSSHLPPTTFSPTIHSFYLLFAFSHSTLYSCTSPHPIYGYILLFYKPGYMVWFIPSVRMGFWDGQNTILLYHCLCTRHTLPPAPPARSALLRTFYAANAHTGFSGRGHTTSTTRYPASSARACACRRRLPQPALHLHRLLGPLASACAISALLAKLYTLCCGMRMAREGRAKLYASWRHHIIDYQRNSLISRKNQDTCASRAPRAEHSRTTTLPLPAHCTYTPAPALPLQPATFF